MKSFISGALAATVTLSAPAFAQELPPDPPIAPPPATPAPDGEANAPAAPAPPPEATEPAPAEATEATTAGQLGIDLNGADAKVEGEANAGGSADTDASAGADRAGLLCFSICVGCGELRAAPKSAKTPGAARNSPHPTLPQIEKPKALARACRPIALSTSLC
jgi:hypothetical protein